MFLWLRKSGCRRWIFTLLFKLIVFFFKKLECKSNEFEKNNWKFIICSLALFNHRNMPSYPILMITPYFLAFFYTFHNFWRKINSLSLFQKIRDTVKNKRICKISSNFGRLIFFYLKLYVILESITTSKLWFHRTNNEKNFRDCYSGFFI